MGGTLSTERLTGPTALADRLPGPDVARGALLALIALSNAPLYLVGRPLAMGGYPVDRSGADQVVIFADTAAVVWRAYPMFAALLGYGVVQLWNRQLAAGLEPRQVRRMIRRRGWWLVVFGLVHAVLLWSGDILGPYGIILLLFGAGLISAGPVGKWILGILSALMLAGGGAVVTSTPVAEATEVVDSMAEPDFLAAAGFRLTEWAITVAFQPLVLIGAVMIGAWAARCRLLEEPERHLRTLRWFAAIGLSVAVVGGLPWAAVVAGYWTEASPGQLVIAGLLHNLCGYGGIGYVALIALVVVRNKSRDSRILFALRACGRRSLTCYLLQSLFLAVLLAPFAFGLGARVGAATIALIGLAAWLADVLVAVLLERTGHRGPAETLLRRLTYRTG